MQKPTFREAMRFWLRLGFISFGGPAGQIAIMHEYLVARKKWISDSRFLHALNYCMILPGPEAQQLATYIGWLLHGTAGGLAAGLLFVLPSLFILLALSVGYVSFGSLPVVYAIFNGLKPAVIAIIMIALFKIGKKSLLTPFHYIIAVSAFIVIYFFQIPFPLIIISTIAISLLAKRFAPQLFISQNKPTKKNEVDESEFYINKNSSVEAKPFQLWQMGKQVVIGAALWLVPLIAFGFFSNDLSFWKTLSVFFTQAAFVTFGGAYAVLPYVAQVSVEKYHWLSNLQMIDGLALGETTPGPLIMVLSFVGFMAGFHHSAGSLWVGMLGLTVTTFYTFLPSFLFIFIGAPFIERTRQNQSIRMLLSFVTAAVVGVILNLTVYLCKAVVFPNGMTFRLIDYVALAWILISFFAMYQKGIGIIKWIGISAVFGLGRYLFIVY